MAKKIQKNERITVRFTPEQYANIRAKAEFANMSLSEYMRLAADKNRILRIDGLRELSNQVVRIGVNLNQLTYRANISREIPKKAVLNMQKDIHEIKDEIVKTLARCA